MVQLRMGSLNAVVVSEGPDVKEVLHTKVNKSFFRKPDPTRQQSTGLNSAMSTKKIKRLGAGRNGNLVILVILVNLVVLVNLMILEHLMILVHQTNKGR